LVERDESTVGNAGAELSNFVGVGELASDETDFVVAFFVVENVLLEGSFRIAVAFLG
jgi:hypothetical protein